MLNNQTNVGLNMEDFVIVFEYSRAQALADGVLIDATKLAREVGFVIPVALTAACWNRCVLVPDGVLGQDETGRLWDVLNLLYFHIQSLRRHAKRCGVDHVGHPLDFCVDVLNGLEKLETVQLKGIIGPGDNAEPVITVMLPEED